MAQGFEIKRGDLRPHYRVQLLQTDPNSNSGAFVPVDLTGAVSVKFLMKQGNSVKVTSAATFLDQVNGIVEYAWTSADTDTAGDFNVEFEVMWPLAQPQTFPSSGYFTCKINLDLG